MKNTVDFIKIDNGKLGAININNMIPINLKDAHRVDVDIQPSDTKSTINYKILLVKQIRWCDINQHKLEKCTSNLYEQYTSNNLYKILENAVAALIN